LKNRLLKILKRIAYPLIALGLIYLVLKKVDTNEILTALKTAHYGWVLLAALAGLTSHFIRAVRWKMLIEPMGYKSRVRTGFYAVMVGYAVNYATPRFGEVVRCALKSSTDDIPVDKLVGTVFIERVFDLIITAIITLAAVFIQYDIIGNFIAEQFAENGGGSSFKLIVLGGMAVCGIIGIIVYNHLRKKDLKNPLLKMVINLITGLIEGAKSILKLKRPLLFIAYTLIIWLMYFMVSYLIFFALDSTSHLGIDAALTTLIVATIAVIIPAPGGLGSFHYFVPLGLLLYGIEIQAGTNYAIISHASQMLMILLVGGISAILVRFEKKKLNQHGAS
jgi:uncharacterized membrane protein YbhN (UPF0104 family)